MKKYDNYKDSGIEWIGEIPEHWEINRLRNIADSIKTGSTPPSEEIQYFEPQELNWFGPGDFDNLILNNAKRKISNLAIEENKCRLFPSNSILLIGIGATVGKVGIVSEASTSNQQINAIILKNEYNPKYYTYFISTIKDIIVMEASSATLPIFNQTQTKNIVLPVPQIEEQTTIANYLDHKTTQIDTLITKKEQFISLLQEERTAVINQAVTKGLDPKVKMKDSGIEWLGEIPEQWTSYRIDWVTNIVRGNTGFKKDELLGNGEYVALQYGKTYKVDIVDDSFNFFVNSEFFKESQVVSKGDTILISTSETVEDLGHTCFYNNGNIGLLGGEQILLKPNRKVLYEKYLYQYARQFGLELKKYAKGLKVFRFNTTDLKQIFIAIPSIEEQIQIADFLDRETIRIDSLISKSQQEIELLKEYKTALISEVVTGKVDVREEILN
jgi:type I restriction enzyme S subunit